MPGFSRTMAWLKPCSIERKNERTKTIFFVKIHENKKWNKKKKQKNIPNSHCSLELGANRLDPVCMPSYRPVELATPTSVLNLHRKWLPDVAPMSYHCTDCSAPRPARDRLHKTFRTEFKPIPSALWKRLLLRSLFVIDLTFVQDCVWTALINAIIFAWPGR